MSPSNIPRSKSIRERISHYLSKRINGEPEPSPDWNQRNPTEQRFSDLSQVLQGVARQPPPAKLGFRQRFMAALDSRETVKRSSTTRHRRHYRQHSLLQRSASTPQRPHNREHSSSIRGSSSVTRGRQRRREDSSRALRYSSTEHRQNHREHCPLPQSSPIAGCHSPQPLPRSRSYRPTSFATKPSISAPVAFVNLNDHPALRNSANVPQTPLTNRTDSLDRADFDIPPTLRSQRKGSEPQPTTQMPLHRRAGSQPAVDGDSHLMAPRGKPKHSVVSTSTRWGDFISEFQSTPASIPASNQAAKATPSPPPSRGRSQGRSQSPAKFPSFPPAAHQSRAQSPRARKPVVNPNPSFPRSASNHRSRGPVTCELCRGLSDPNISYPEVKRHLCSKCARIAFVELGGELGGEPGKGPAREPRKPTTVPLPPTPPVKDFAGFNFVASSVSPATPSSTGSQPKFEAYSTTSLPPPANATVEEEPLDTYQSSATIAQPYHPSSTVHRPRPPSSEYSSMPARSRFPSNMGNPYASRMGNPFTSPHPLDTVQRAASTSTTQKQQRKPVPPPTLPRAVSGAPSTWVTLSPYPNNYSDENFVPFLPPPIPEQHPNEEDDEGRNRRSSFYHFYDDVLGSARGGGMRDKGKGKGGDKGKGKEGEWWDDE